MAGNEYTFNINYMQFDDRFVAGRFGQVPTGIVPTRDEVTNLPHPKSHHVENLLWWFDVLSERHNLSSGEIMSLRKSASDLEEFTPIRQELEFSASGYPEKVVDIGNLYGYPMHSKNFWYNIMNSISGFNDNINTPFPLTAWPNNPNIPVGSSVRWLNGLTGKFKDGWIPPIPYDENASGGIDIELGSHGMFTKDQYEQLFPPETTIEESIFVGIPLNIYRRGIYNNDLEINVPVFGPIWTTGNGSTTNNLDASNIGSVGSTTGVHERYVINQGLINNFGVEKDSNSIYRPHHVKHNDSLDVYGVYHYPALHIEQSEKEQIANASPPFSDTYKWADKVTLDIRNPMALEIRAEESDLSSLTFDLNTHEGGASNKDALWVYETGAYINVTGWYPSIGTFPQDARVTLSPLYSPGHGNPTISGYKVPIDYEIGLYESFLNTLASDTSIYSFAGLEGSGETAWYVTHRAWINQLGPPVGAYLSQNQNLDDTRGSGLIGKDQYFAIKKYGVENSLKAGLWDVVAGTWFLGYDGTDIEWKHYTPSPPYLQFYGSSYTSSGLITLGDGTSAYWPKLPLLDEPFPNQTQPAFFTKTDTDRTRVLNPASGAASIYFNFIDDMVNYILPYLSVKNISDINTSPGEDPTHVNNTFGTASLSISGTSDGITYTTTAWKDYNMPYGMYKDHKYTAFGESVGWDSFNRNGSLYIDLGVSYGYCGVGRYHNPIGIDGEILPTVGMGLYTNLNRRLATFDDLNQTNDSWPSEASGLFDEIHNEYGSVLYTDETRYSLGIRDSNVTRGAIGHSVSCNTDSGEVSIEPQYCGTIIDASINNLNDNYFSAELKAEMKSRFRAWFTYCGENTLRNKIGITDKSGEVVRYQTSISSARPSPHMGVVGGGASNAGNASGGNYLLQNRTRFDFGPSDSTIATENGVKTFFWNPTDNSWWNPWGCTYNIAYGWLPMPTGNVLGDDIEVDYRIQSTFFGTTIFEDFLLPIMSSGLEEVLHSGGPNLNILYTKSNMEPTYIDNDGNINWGTYEDVDIDLTTMLDAEPPYPSAIFWFAEYPDPVRLSAFPSGLVVPSLFQQKGQVGDFYGFSKPAKAEFSVESLPKGYRSHINDFRNIYFEQNNGTHPYTTIESGNSYDFYSATGIQSINVSASNGPTNWIRESGMIVWPSVAPSSFMSQSNSDYAGLAILGDEEYSFHEIGNLTLTFNTLVGISHQDIRLYNDLDPVFSGYPDIFPSPSMKTSTNVYTYNTIWLGPLNPVSKYQ